MRTNLISILTIFLLVACTQKATNSLSTQTGSNYSLQVVQAIPEPKDMLADVIVNARVSTVKQVDVAYVGKQIPFTYSDGKISNSPGFDWYVSKHFALRTDYKSEQAKKILELLEMSYPHYIEYFGMEPLNISNQRIASTYASSNDALRKVMFDDGFNRGIHHNAGGEAMYYNWVGYSFPTERPQHRRYILIHETMHSYQMALANYPWTPSWYSEGQGDSFAGHVFDSKKKRLAVYGHDVPIFDSVTRGLGLYVKEIPTLIDIHNRSPFNRGLNVLFVQFMHNNPEYSQYLKIYHQEVMTRQTASKKESLEILQSVVPDWELLESAFKEWVSGISKSHEVAYRGQWEIDANMFYKRPSNYKYGSQRLGINFVPGEKPNYKEFMVSYPAPEKSELLLPIKRGISEPTIGFEVSYLAESLSKGSIGMALGILSTAQNIEAKSKNLSHWKNADTDLDEQFRIEIQSARNLILDDRTLGGTLSKIELPEELIRSLVKQTKPRIGVSIHIKKTALEITLKTKNANPFIVNHLVSSERHQQIFSRKIGLVSKKNHHGITPYIDDGRDLNPRQPNFHERKAANAWGFEGDDLSLRFARAIWRSGEESPEIWRKSFARLNLAALDFKQGHLVVTNVEENMTKIARAGSNNKEGLVELSGVQFQLGWLGKNSNQLKQYAVVTNNSKIVSVGNFSFSALNKIDRVSSVTVSPGQRIEIPIPEEIIAHHDSIQAKFEYIWHGIKLEQSQAQKTSKYPGLTLETPTANYEKNRLTISSKLFGPFNGDTKGIVTIDLYYGSKKLSYQSSIEIDPYQMKALEHEFKIEEKMLDDSAWIEVTLAVDSDGEPILLRKRASFTPTKYAR